MAEAAPPIALYVHWPFCQSKCPYCDFNSHVRERVDHRAWRRALLAELAYAAAQSPGRRLTSIFFGGGTPSRMDPETAGDIIDAARAAWPGGEAIEITLEANPTSVETARLSAFRDAGFNRVSIGVQALDDDALRFLGRPHDAKEALTAVAIAARLFPRMSFDLIYGRPRQDLASWQAELRRALAHAGGHVSLYQLTVEKGTPFFAEHRRGAFALPDEPLAAALYNATQDMMAAAGLPAYEISNHAAPGQECRHNLAYWLADEYAGIGPGAHGRLLGPDGWLATERISGPEAWRASTDRLGHGTRAEHPVALAERVEEMVMMGLRLAGGIERERFERIAGATFEEWLDPVRLDRLLTGGFLVLDAHGLRASDGGRRRLDAVLATLLE